MLQEILGGLCRSDSTIPRLGKCRYKVYTFKRFVLAPRVNLRGAKLARRYSWTSSILL